MAGNSMLALIKIKLRSFLSDERTIKTATNIFFVVLIKFLSIVLSFLSIPVALRYLNASEYGVWLTINSILVWFTIFDIGLSNGLRNKITEALAAGKIELCKVYISTTYSILILISIGCSVVFVLANYWIDWGLVLNTRDEHIQSIITIVVLLFFIRFVLQTINIVFQAHNKYSVPGFWDLFGNSVFLIYLFLLQRFAEPSLLYVAVGYSVIFTVTLLIQNILYFNTSFKLIRPSFRSINLKYSKDLMLLSINFLIIQLGGLIVFSSNNIIISHFINPEQVSVYTIAYKYYNVITIAWALMLTPYLTSFNEAYHLHDFDWIKRHIRQLNIFLLLIIVLVVLMTFLSGIAYRLWIGDQLIIPLEISITMAIYTIIVARINLYGYFINGTGKLKVSALYGIFTVLVNIPLLYFALNYLHSGLAGIVIVNCVVLLPNVFLTTIQYRKLISETASGIWLK